MAGRSWMPSEERHVQAMWIDGKADQEIADLIGRTPTAVRKRRQLRGWIGEVVSVDRNRIRQLHAEGYNALQIAERVGCTHRTAQEYLYREGLRTRSGHRRR